MMFCWTPRSAGYISPFHYPFIINTFLWILVSSIKDIKLLFQIKLLFKQITSILFEALFAGATTFGCEYMTNHPNINLCIAFWVHIVTCLWKLYIIQRLSKLNALMIKWFWKYIWRKKSRWPRGHRTYRLSYKPVLFEVDLFVWQGW